MTREDGAGDRPEGGGGRKRQCDRVLWGGCVAIALCALSWLSVDQRSVPDLQRRTDATGLDPGEASRFVYFARYLHQFPVTSTALYSAEDSPSGARAFLRTNGVTLRQEVQAWARLGNNARVLVYVPDLLLGGSSLRPSARPFNTLVLALSAELCWIGAARLRRRVFGATLAAFVLLNPFLIASTHAQENILGLPLVATMGFLGAELLLRSSKRVWPTWVGTIAIGLVGAVLLGMRNEILFPLVGLAVLRGLAPGRRRIRIAQGAVIVVVFFLGQKALDAGFARLDQRARSFVAEHGGIAYSGPRLTSHRTFHPLWCGLGDFGQDRGFRWDDRVAYAAVLPDFERRLGRKVNWSGGYFLDEWWGPDHTYPKKFDDFPDYEAAVRASYLATIRHHPLWFVGVLVRRVWRLLWVASPFPGAAWAVPLAGIVAVRRRSTVDLTFLACGATSWSTAVLVYSGGGTPLLGAAPTIAVALLAEEVFRFRRRPARQDTVGRGTSRFTGRLGYGAGREGG